MKNTIALITLIMSTIGLYVAVDNVTNERLILGFISLALHGFIIASVGNFLVQNLKKVRMFTIMELLGVIVVTAFLLSIGIRALTIHHLESQTQRLSSELALVISNSYSSSDPILFTLSSDYNSKVSKSFSHPTVYFLKGLPVDADSEPILNYQITLTEGVKTPVVISVNGFTGRVKYY